MKHVEEERLLEMLLTVKDVAELLSVGIRTVWRWTELGKIPAPVRLGQKTTRWKASDIQAYLDAVIGAARTTTQDSL